MSSEDQAKTENAPELSRSGQPLVKVARSKRKGNVENFRKNTAPPLEAPPASPPVEQSGGAHTSGDEIPPTHPDPAWRDKPTIGGIEFTDDGLDLLNQPPDPEYQPPDQADGSLRTLDDLMGTFPIGDGSGQWFVHVERKRPPIWGGLATKGVQRKILDKMSLEDFREVYGGGEYELIVYGPPKRPQVFDRNGAARPKAMTKPIRLTIPYHGEGGFAPNPESAHEEERDSEDEMRSDGTYAGIPDRLLTRGVTPAAAKMVDSALGHNERMDSRDRQDRREREMSERSSTNEAVRLLEESHRRIDEARDRENRELKAKLQKLEERPAGIDLAGMGSFVQSLNPRASSTEIEQLRSAHSRELESRDSAHRQETDSLNRRHSEELTRLGAAHREELTRQSARADAAEQRASTRVKEVEDRIPSIEERWRTELNRAREELRSEHTRQVDHLEREQARSMQAQKEMYEGRIEQEHRSHGREILTKDQISQSILSTEKSKLETEIRQLKTEAARREEDVKKLERLADKNKDLGRAIEEARRQAEALGMVMAGDADQPETDWKTLLAGVVTEAAKRMPEVLRGAGDAVAAVRGLKAGPEQQMSPTPARMAQLPVAQGYRPQAMQGFATEDSGIQPSGSPVFPDYPSGYGVRPSPMAPPPPQPVTQMAQAQVAPAAPAAQEASPMLPAAAPAAQAAQPAPAAQPPPAAAGADQFSQIDELVLQGKGQLEGSFESRTEPSVIAKFLIDTYGPQVVRANAQVVNPLAMRGALTRRGLSSPLLSRSGQKYLRAIESAVLAELSKAEGVIAT